MGKNTIEIHTVVKNGGEYVPLFLQHYQQAFPECSIFIYDNGSTDDTKKLCMKAGCTIKPFQHYSEAILQQHKNTVWQTSKADWVIICDIDELVQVNQADIDALPEDVNILTFEGWQIFSRTGKKAPLGDLTYGVRAIEFDKYAMFKPGYKRVVYNIGAHTATTNGKKSKQIFKLLHYNTKYLSPPFKNQYFPIMAKRGKQIL